MKLTYHPEGSTEPTVWNIDLGKIRVKAMRAIETATRMAFGSEFKVALLKGNSLARQAMLWHLLRETHPGKFKHIDDVDFADGEVLLEQSAAEWRESYKELSKMEKVPGLSEEEREAALQQMLNAIAEAEAKEAAEAGMPAPADGPEVEPAGGKESSSEPSTT